MATVAPAQPAPGRGRGRPAPPADAELEGGLARLRPVVLVAALGVAALQGTAQGPVLGPVGSRALLIVTVAHVVAALVLPQAPPSLRRATAVPATLADLAVTAGLVAATGGGASVLAALGPVQGFAIGLRFRPVLAVALGVVAAGAFAAAIDAVSPRLVGGWTVTTVLAVAAGGALARRWAQERRRFHAVRREAQRTSRDQADALRRLCHELRTPIASLSALSRAVGGSTPMPPDARRRALDLVERHADHLAGVLDDVRAFTDAAKAGRPVGATTCDVWLPAVVDAAAAAADLDAERLDVRVDPAVSVVRLDPVKVRQVLTNLLENARRHGAPDRPVVVRATTASGRLRLVVANAGGGSGSPGEAGSGLGLGIVVGLVDAMGGSLAPASWHGGLRVTVELPTDAARSGR